MTLGMVRHLQPQLAHSSQLVPQELDAHQLVPQELDSRGPPVAF